MNVLYQDTVRSSDSKSISIWNALLQLFLVNEQITSVTYNQYRVVFQCFTTREFICECDNEKAVQILLVAFCQFGLLTSTHRPHPVYMHHIQEIYGDGHYLHDDVLQDLLHRSPQAGSMLVGMGMCNRQNLDDALLLVQKYGFEALCMCFETMQETGEVSFRDL